MSHSEWLSEALLKTGELDAFSLLLLRDTPGPRLLRHTPSWERKRTHLSKHTYTNMEITALCSISLPIFIYHSVILIYFFIIIIHFTSCFILFPKVLKKPHSIYKTIPGRRSYFRRVKWSAQRRIINPSCCHVSLSLSLGCWEMSHEGVRYLRRFQRSHNRKVRS